jgi:hypothetical protein
MARPARKLTQEAAETIAIDALAELAADPERLGRFLTLTGLAPETLRDVAGAPGFLAAVLQHLAEDEPALLAFAANRGIAPETVEAARSALAGPAFERDHP